MSEVIITVASKVGDGKGGFKITDTLGEEYILSAKNKSMENQLVIGRATTITPFESSYGRFINAASLFDGKPPEDKQVPHINAGVETKVAPIVSGQETGMWWKELGECLRSGFVTSEALRKVYLAKMYDVIGFEPQIKQPPKEEPQKTDPEDIPF